MAVSPNKKQIMITLRHEFLAVLQDMAEEKDTTKSKVIESWLERIAKRIKRRQNVETSADDTTRSSETLNTSA